jgi:hypothetical protein
MYVTLVDHLTGSFRGSVSLVLLAVLGFGLALRGRRVLFAAPALSLVLAPALIDLYHGAGFSLPGLIGGFGVLSLEHGRWVYWVEAGIKLVLVLIPGALVATQIRSPRNLFHPLAVGLLAVPAWVVGYYGVIYFSGGGQLEGWQGAGYLVVFSLGAAMGFDRPVWPWAVIAVPLLTPNWIHPLIWAEGAEYLLYTGIALIGAATVPLSRVCLRAWQEDRDTDQSFAHNLG